MHNNNRQEITPRRIGKNFSLVNYFTLCCCCFHVTQTIFEATVQAREKPFDFREGTNIESGLISDRDEGKEEGGRKYIPMGKNCRLRVAAFEVDVTILI